MRLALLAIPAVRSALELELGRTIEYHVTLPSTQDRARELEASGSRRLVVVAEEQTAGRGTHGRSWRAPARTSLLAAWTFRPAPAEPALFALLAGVAVARALRTFGVADLGLKWPNDVWLTGGKIAGCLAHADGGGLVIGIGVNVSQRELPREIADIATSLARAGHDIDRLALVARLTRELDVIADPAAHADALAEWRKRSITVGREVEVTITAKERIRGKASGLADDGALLVETPYGQQRVIAGEVRVLG